MLSARLATAFPTGATPDVHRSRHGDFQANGVLALVRGTGRPARLLAADILARADLSDLATAEVSGPGYINLTLRSRVLDDLLAAMGADPRLGVPTAADPKTVVIDYGGPNVAKQMHVGHLRSTVIGDALARVLRWLGHDVRLVSHLGDWGTPFGMLLEWLIEIGENRAAEKLSVGDLDDFYKAARARFDADPAFVDRSRRRVVALQSGDPESVRLWRILVEESARYFEAVNTTLGVLLSTMDFKGESAYNDQLDDVVAELTAKGLVHSSEGALVVYPPGFDGRDGQGFGFMVGKSDGGYGYQTTDLAAIRERLRVADEIVYVTGAPQRQHLAMVFAVARQAGWLTAEHRVTHKPFGSVLGPDGRMLRSRSGSSVTLIDLLDAAVARAAQLAPDLDRTLGVGAVKYAELSADMISDVVFDLDRMVAFTGDTAGYLQMAHARARSILRQSAAQPGPPRPRVPAERGLALALLGFPRSVEQMAAELEPHRLAGQLRTVAVAFTGFWENAPVLRAEAAVRSSRLALCDLTARVLARGLDLLGIDAPGRM